MSDAARILSKIAAECYDATAEAGQEFDVEDVIALVVSDPGAGMLGPALLTAAAQAAVERVDKSRRARPEQEGLFGDLDRVLAIGEGRRRRKGSCRAEDYAAHMQIITENAAAVATAAAKEQAEYVQLLPFLNAGHTVEEAAALIRGDA